MDAGLDSGQAAGPPPGVVFGPPVQSSVPAASSAPPPGVVFGPPVAPAPQDVSSSANPTQQPSGHILDRVASVLQDAPEIAGPIGFMHGAMKTVAGLSELMNRPTNPMQAAEEEQARQAGTPMQPHIQALKSATDWLRAHAEDKGIWQQMGDMGENVAELLVPGLGEEAGAAKAGEAAATFADKAAQTAKMAKFLEQNKKLSYLAALGARTLKAAATSGARVAAEAGGQTFVKTGGDLPATAQAAALGGVGGAVVGGAAGGIGAARGANAAATATRDAAQTAFDTSPEVLAQRTAAMKTARQATAQQMVKDTAKGATRGAIDRMNEARQAVMTDIPGVPAREGADTIDEGIKAVNARQQLGSMANIVPDRLLPKRNPIVDEIGQRAALVPKKVFAEIPSPGTKTTSPNFAPIDADAAAARTTTFGDAANEARTAAKQVYDRLDQATGGKFNELRDARNAAYKAGGTKSPEYLKATNEINDLMATGPKGVAPGDFAAAKSAWKDERDLDRIHNAVEGAFNGITEDMAAQPGTSARELKGGQATGALQARVGTLLRGKNALGDERIRELLGPEGMTGLYRASHLTSTPELRKATQELADAVAKEFPKPEASAKPGIGTVVGHLTGTGLAAGALAHATGTPYVYNAAGIEGARYVLHQVVTNPAIGKMFEYAVDYGATPQNAAKTIAAMIQQQETAQSMQTRDSAKQSQEKR